MSQADPGFDAENGGDPAEEEQTEFGAEPTTGDPQNSGDSEENVAAEQLNKYKKGYEHAQKHIRQLEAERQEDRDAMAQLKQELERRPTVDEVMERIQENREAAGQTRRDPDNTPSIDPEELVNKAAERVAEEQRKQQEKQIHQANLQECVEAAKQVYGDEVNSAVAEKARELDMTVDEVNRMAATKPKAFRKMFIDGAEPKPAPSRSAGVSPVEGRPAPAGEGKGKDTQEVYRQNPRKYLTDPSVMEEIAKRKGLR